MKNIFQADPRYDGLNEAVSFGQKIHIIHQTLQKEFPFIQRVSINLYDAQMATLSTFIQSSPETNLTCYECPIEKAPSLNQMRLLKKTRVVNDLSLFKNGKNLHTRQIAALGYQSSYSVPMFDRDIFVGIVFFNALSPNVFTPETLGELSHYTQLINCLIINKLQTTRTLIGSFRGALSLVSYKDPETGNHLERMARYSKLIAQSLTKTGKTQMDDEMIEYLYLFAPLHDIGKIGIPDHILLKPGKLNADEWTIMQTHSSKGREIINSIAGHLGLEAFGHINLLRDISGSHHETIDGKGYPNRLEKDDIPIETQIVTVADIFDALTSERPYKPAWSNEDAFHELSQLAESKLNPDCVHALIANQPAIADIQKRFQDEQAA